MTYQYYFDLVRWTTANLHATTKSIPPDMLARWENLEGTDAEAFANLALYGYVNNQMQVNDKMEAQPHELQEFLGQFGAKIRLAKLQTVIPSDLPLFEITTEKLPVLEPIYYW